MGTWKRNNQFFKQRENRK